MCLSQCEPGWWFTRRPLAAIGGSEAHKTGGGLGGSGGDGSEGKTQKGDRAVEAEEEQRR